MARLTPRLALLCLIGLAGCTGTVDATFDASGKAMPQVYRIQSADVGRIQVRMLQAVNSLRAARGLGALALNAELNAAAATHARDMSVQNRPWHFGSDGSSPIDRVARAGYGGALRGELISETYETELETLSGWMERDDTRLILFDPEAREMGLGVHQEQAGKLWWALVLGDGGAGGAVRAGS